MKGQEQEQEGEESSGKSEQIASFLWLQKATLGSTGRRREARSVLHCHAARVLRSRFFRALAAERFEMVRGGASGSKSKKGEQEGPGARARRQEKAAANAKKVATFL